MARTDERASHGGKEGTARSGAGSAFDYEDVLDEVDELYYTLLALDEETSQSERIRKLISR